MEYNEVYFKNLLPKRPEISNKGTFGHCLNIAGSGFYTGAAYFSSIAPLIVGAGRSTLATTEAAITKIASLSPDIIYLPLDSTKDGFITTKAIKKIEARISEFNVISIGCGLSTNKETVKFFEKLLPILKISNKPVIIDADGLNILSTLENRKLNDNFILTPHPKELSRLMTISTEQILSSPEFWIEKAVEKFNCNFVLKMHETLVLSSKNADLYKNHTGNSALSHGGSGDVLCGMISGFIAQGLSVFDAATLAVYLHGKASELSSADLTEYSAITSDLLKYIPKAIKGLL